MPISRITTWADGTIQTVAGVACYVKSIIAYPGRARTDISYLRLWNALGTTPETTAADMVLPLRDPAVGAGAAATRFVHKFIFPNAGVQFDTGCLIFVAETTGSAVAPATGPTVEVHWAPIQ